METLTKQTPSEWLLEQYDKDPTGFVQERGTYNPTAIASIKWDHLPDCRCETDDQIVNNLYFETV